MTIDQGNLSRTAPRSGPKGSGMGGGLVPGVFDQAESMRPTLYGEKWSVVAGHPLVTEVAADVLRAGGNAIDAGVTAGFASNVVQVEMCNLGGIAPILVREAKGAVHSIAGIGKWGRDASLERMTERYGQSLPLGGAPCIVPGALSGWLTALARFGTMSLNQILPPVIELAWKGFPLDPRTASNIAIMGRGFTKWQSSVDVYAPGGVPLRSGDRLIQRDLGELLAGLVEAEARALRAGASREGAIDAAHAWFYQGEIAEQIARFVTENGGYLDKADLADFRADVETAPAVDFGQWSVHVTPTWSQGPIIAQALGILERRGIRNIPSGTAEYFHEVIEALKVAFSERERTFGDPQFAPEPMSDLFRPDRLDELAELITATAAENLPTLPAAGPRLPSTTAIVVEDADGNTFAASPSDTIDGGPLIPGLGIICSPRGVQSRLSADHPNALRPGARPCVTPAAMIAVEREPDPSADDSRVWAIACPGGDVIVQAVVQAMLQMDVYGESPQSAVEAPRVFGASYPGGFHPHPSGNKTVFVEASVPESVRDELAERGHSLVPWPANEFDAGSVQTVLDVEPPTGGRRLIAAGADSRRTAYASAR